MRKIRSTKVHKTPIELRLGKYEAALKRISVEHIFYDNGQSPYEIGVVDGHRCAAQIAHAALGDCPRCQGTGEYTNGAATETCYCPAGDLKRRDKK